MRKIPVLIVGGGPVGLALAAELGSRGIACMLVEQTDGSIVTPKMNEVNIRTMEICRRWGIAERVLNCPFPADFPLDVAFVTNLFGYEMGRVPRPSRRGQAPPVHSPYWLQACSQIWFDPILADFARSFGHVELRYRKRLEHFADGGDHVRAEILDRESGVRETIEADYLVGCDGANSAVRQALDIGLSGKGSIGNPVHLFFRAPDLLRQSGHALTTFFLLADRNGFWGNLRIIDPVNGIWRLMAEDSHGSLTPQTIDREAYLRRALGRPVAVEWLGASIWKRMSVVAERYGKGRVFLAGDAVHQLSPTGALGMNTGIGDAVDLGWKLAAVLQGWGGASLLESYDAERHPIGERNVRMATSFYSSAKALARGVGAVENDGPAGDAARRELGEALIRDVGREFRTIGLQIGYRYEDSPICLSDGTAPPPDEPAEYVPSARPGSRAPHAWLADGRSTLDLFGQGFTLLRFSGAPEATALGAAAARAAVPMKEIVVTDSAAAKSYERNYVLVRPDGHVAWRADVLPENPNALIDRVRGAI